MVFSEPHWDHHIPLPKLGALYSRMLTASVALLCFINSYDGDFVFDDSEAIINNKDLKPDTPLSNIWKNDFWGSNLSSNSSHKSYRPLTVLTFRVNYLLAGGLHPIGFHALNVALHCIISVLMIDVFAILICGTVDDGRGTNNSHPPKASLLAALFFATHPVHTESGLLRRKLHTAGVKHIASEKPALGLEGVRFIETTDSGLRDVSKKVAAGLQPGLTAVAGVVGRADLMCALFFQLSFLLYCKAFQGGNKKFSLLWIFGSILLCAVAMLCKEQGITVLGVNAAYDLLMVCNLNVYELLLTKRKSFHINGLAKSGVLIRLGILFVGGSLLLYLRWRIMGTGPPSFTEVDNPASFAESLMMRIVNYNYYYSLNAWLLLCPWWLCFDWSMGCVPLIKSATDWRIVWPVVLWCCLMGLLSQALCSQDSSKRRTLTFGLVLMVIPFLPASNLFFRVGFVIAERVLYLSSAGYCLILAYAVGYSSCHWRKHKRLLRAAMLTLLCVNVVRSAQRSQQWRSEQSLFTSALSVCPLNAKVRPLTCMLHYEQKKNVA
ncbi:hypothetical protein DNTS_032809 [Danionella cerebrum]|uniref:DUF1736 domain-containing protein n=1 Tax=Danionella cerebrum TaxID=2873325 RepID=A0A553PXQ3_9TELE|nr:hypothetical protein DNTS_032809 [Danionella translucida]